MIAPTPVRDRSARPIDQIALLALLVVGAGGLSVAAWQVAAVTLAGGFWLLLGSRRSRAGAIVRCARCGAEARECFCDRLMTHEPAGDRPTYGHAA